MPYIGNAPYQGLVDSGNIVDGGVQTIDLANSSVTTAKVADGNITTAKVVDGGITTAKLASASVTAAKLASDVTDLITVGGSPKITSVVVTNSSYTALDDTAVDVAGGYIKIIGTGFSNGCQVLINNTAATSVTFISATEVRAQVPATSAGTYVLYVVNSDGGVGIRVNGITFSSIPAWSTGSTLSSAGSDEAISIQLSASSNSAITYTLQAGSTLPTGLSLSSGGLLSGTIVGLQNETTYNFTILATDVENQDTSRAFSITITVGLPDDYYKSVVLHLPGNGTNLATNNQFLDSSVNNFSITRSGNATQGTFSPFSQTGWGNYFNGTGDSLTVSYNAAFEPSSSDFTIEGWYFLTETGVTENPFFVVGSATYYPIGVSFLSSTGWKVQINASYTGSAWAFNRTGTTTVSANTWVHVAVVRNSTSLDVYVNGTKDNGASGAIAGSLASGAGGISLGAYRAGGTAEYFGYMSNVRYVVGSAVYTGNFTPSTSPLTAITNTKLLTCQSNRFIDNSTLGSTITRNGDTRVVAFSPFNPTASWSAATYGGSAYFDGNGDYISTTTSATFGTSDFTLDWWVYHIAAPNPCWLWDGAFNSGTYPQIFITTSGTSFRYLNGAGTALITATITNRLNEWVHYRICRSGSTVRLFINGVYIAQATDSTNYSSTFRGGFGARARDGLEGNQAYFGGFQAVMTALSTTNDNFTPPSGPMPLLSNTSLLLNFTNAGILDATSKNVLETVGDAKISTTQSKWAGSSIYLDGTGDWLRIPASPNLDLGTGTATVECWLYLTAAIQDYRMIISDVTSGSNYIALRSLNNTGTQVEINVNAVSFRVELNGAISLNSWHHFAVTRIGSNFKVFVSGRLVGTGSSAAAWNLATGGTLIGRWGGATAYEWPGYIDDLRITKDVARYWYNFTPPAKQFKVSYGATPTPATDEYFDYTTLLLAGNGGNTLQNNSFVDSSTNNFSITRSGNTTQGTFSPFSQTGWSNYFAGPAAVGGDHYLLIPSNAAFTLGTGDFTFECWFFNYYDGSGNAGFIDLGDANTAGSFAVFLNGGDLIVRIGGLGNDLTFNATSLIQAGIWYHLAVVRSGSTLTTYVDGVAKASGTRAQNITQNSPYIGAIRPTYGIRLQGNLSNVRLVKGTAVYTSNFTPPTTPLTNITNTSLLTCQSNRFVDNSSNNHALTINGSPSVQAFSPFNPTAAYSAATVGGSGYFDGSGDFLNTTTGIAIGSSNFTYECWVYPAASQSGNPRIFEIGGNNNDYLLLQYASSTSTLALAIGSGGAGTTVCSTTITFPFAWTHIAVVREGTGSNQVKMYINGVNVSTGTSSTSIPSTFAYIGGISWSSPFHWNGYISSARLVIGTAVYTSAFTPPTAPLTAITNTSLLLNFTNAGIIDSTAKNVLETVGNAQISTTQSKFGGASLAFDGTGDALVIPASVNLDFSSADFTIEAWINITSLSAVREIASNRASSAAIENGGWYWEVSTSGVVWFGTRNTASTLLEINGGSLSINTWYHIAVVRFSSNLSIYVGGNRVATSTSATGSYGSSTLPVRVGAIGTTNDYSMNGYIDDFRITKGIARYVQNFTPPSAALQLL